MSNEYIRNPSDALGFFHSTCAEQGLFVDTDKGFLKADGTSAFASITDEEAQKAQEALQESIEMLAQFDVDAWEVMHDIALLEATLRHVRQRTHSMHTVEFIEALSAQGKQWSAVKSLEDSQEKAQKSALLAEQPLS